MLVCKKNLIQGMIIMEITSNMLKESLPNFSREIEIYKEEITKLINGKSEYSQSCYLINTYTIPMIILIIIFYKPILHKVIIEVKDLNGLRINEEIRTIFFKYNQIIIRNNISRVSTCLMQEYFIDKNECGILLGDKFNRYVEYMLNKNNQ